jgi:hypothetical protein
LGAPRRILKPGGRVPHPDADGVNLARSAGLGVPRPGKYFSPQLIQRQFCWRSDGARADGQCRVAGQERRFSRARARLVRLRRFARLGGARQPELASRGPSWHSFECSRVGLLGLWRFAYSPNLSFSPQTTYRDMTARMGRGHVELPDRQGTAQNQRVGACQNRKSRATFSRHAKIGARREFIGDPNLAQNGRKAGSTFY